MTREEALNTIIDGLPNMEDYEEALDVLTQSVASNSDVDWEGKYHELDNKYRQRFKERLSVGEGENVLADPINAFNKEKDVTLDELDFDGSTE